MEIGITMTQDDEGQSHVVSLQRNMQMDFNMCCFSLHPEQSSVQLQPALSLNEIIVAEHQPHNDRQTIKFTITGANMVVVACRWRPDSDESRCCTCCPLCVSTEQLALHPCTKTTSLVSGFFYLHLSHKLKKLKPTWYFPLVDIAWYVFLTNFALICLFLLKWSLGPIECDEQADETCNLCDLWFPVFPVLTIIFKNANSVIMYSPTCQRSDKVSSFRKQFWSFTANSFAAFF